MCLGVLANEGDNVLIPVPGFSLYQTLLDSKGIEPRGYPLLPEHEWQADLTALEAQIDGKTRAVLINNPSNPCGSVWSRDHLRDILNIAAKHHLPVIADEIYGGMVFETDAFVPAALLASHVPVLSVGGIAKQWLVPGWRVGWILIHDPIGVFGHVRTGLLALSTTILGANSVVQGALPHILRDTPAEFYAETNTKLKTQAEYLVSRLSHVPGLRCIAPKGAMYMMLGLELQQFKDIADDMNFALELLREQSLAVLPGQAFRMKNYIRLVTCAPLDVLTEACNRIEEFCRTHHV
jgi:tyrosine aminotransferase